MKKTFLLLATLMTAQIHGAQADRQSNDELFVDVSAIDLNDKGRKSFFDDKKKITFLFRYHSDHPDKYRMVMEDVTFENIGSFKEMFKDSLVYLGINFYSEKVLFVLNNPKP